MALPENKSLDELVYDGFRRLLGDTSSFRFRLEVSNTSHTPYGIVGAAPLHQAFSVNTYQLKMEFLSPVSLAIRGGNPINQFIIGKYRPHVVSITQDLAHASMVTTLEYHIDSIEDFLGQLDLENWERYSSEFDKDIDKAIRDN